MNLRQFRKFGQGGVIMVTKRRFAAAALAALVIVAVVTSLFIVSHEADHDCIGEDCPVCAVIAACQSTLKTLSAALAVFAAAAAWVCFAVILLTALKAVLHSETPVSLKVRLLN